MAGAEAVVVGRGCGEGCAGCGGWVVVVGGGEVCPFGCAEGDAMVVVVIGNVRPCRGEAWKRRCVARGK